MTPRDFAIDELPAATWVEVIKAANAAVTITPNRRLAAALVAEADQDALRQGLHAWERLDVLPFSAFVARLHDALVHTTHTGSADVPSTATHAPQQITSAQSRVVWSQIVESSTHANGLLSIAQTARQAQSAWEIANQWMLFPALQAAQRNEDAEAFLQWSRRYRDWLREHDAIDLAVMPDVVADMLNAAPREPLARSEVLPQTIFVAGFDIVTPQLLAFLSTCQRMAVSVRRLVIDHDSFERASSTIMPPKRIAFASEQDEINAVANWARHVLMTASPAQPVPRVAIVVPDLANARHAVTRALRETLLPGAMSDVPSPQSSQSDEAWYALVNVSLGIPLIDYGIVADAMRLLEFSLMPVGARDENRGMLLIDVCALIRSPFIAGALHEASPRAKLDAVLREVLPAEVGFATLLQQVTHPRDRKLKAAVDACPQLSAVLLAVDACRAKLLKRANKISLSAARAEFMALLTAWGFPGPRALDSTSFQIVAKLRECISNLVSLDTIAPNTAPIGVFQLLCRDVAETIFQPEVDRAQDAPIEVMGVLESSGQRFDAMWVMGLHEEAWPLAVRPNPFLPTSIQRLAGVPEASANHSLALDQHITAGWIANSAQLIVSHAAFDADGSNAVPRAPSGLIAHIPVDAIDDVLPIVGVSRTFAARGMETYWEPLHESEMPMLPQNTFVRGGANVLKDQAACAFQAFARHRLGAQPLAEITEGLDASERGTLLHQALRFLWDALQSQARLLAMTDEALTETIRDAVQKAIHDAVARGAPSLVGRAAQLEAARLQSLLVRWLEEEKKRAPFSIAMAEDARQISVSGLSLKLRLDRMDALADGRFAIIDYKSGAANVNEWLGERPDQPQLPLYVVTAQTQSENISAVAFAKLKASEALDFAGLADSPESFSASHHVSDVSRLKRAPDGVASWDALRVYWQHQLNKLADDFLRGDARVDPKSVATTCARCELHALCRVREQIQVIDDEPAVDPEVLE